MTDAPLMTIRDLGVTFASRSRQFVAIDGVSLDLEAGTVLGLVGELGSGKSMTALAILGLVPPQGAVTGSIRLDGVEVVGADKATLRSVRGGVAAMIFQNPGAALNPYFTIGGQLTEIVMQHRRVGRAAARAILVGAFGETRIADPDLALARYPHQFSGGQLQRIVIATALACNPKLLVADEPTTALDVTVQAQIVDTLRDLARSRGLGILFITHDLGLVGALCDRVAVMYAGRIVETGKVEDFLAASQHPYSERLLAAVPRFGGPERLATIPGQVPDASAPRMGCSFEPRCQYAMPVCASQSPPVLQSATGATVTCHFPRSGPPAAAGRAGGTS